MNKIKNNLKNKCNQNLIIRSLKIITITDDELLEVFLRADPVAISAKIHLFI